MFSRAGTLPEVTLLNVARGEPLATYLRYESLNPIHIFAVTKPDAADERKANDLVLKTPEKPLFSRVFRGLVKEVRKWSRRGSNP